MSEPKYYTVFEADSAYLKNLGDTNTYFSEFEVRLKTLEALGGTISDGVATLLDVEKAILEQLTGIASATMDIFELRKEIAKAQGLDVDNDFNIWDVAQQEPPVGPRIFTIVFKNWDGTVLQTVEVEEGQTPVYSGSTPTKESDETYDYTFDGWTPDISPATGNVEYVAKYIATEIPSGPDLTAPYVTFVAEQAGSTLYTNIKNYNVSIQYSTDKTTWQTLSSTITLSNIGDEVYVRGKLLKNNTSSEYIQFRMTGKIAAYGNCNAIWNYEDLNAPLTTYCGTQLFKDCTSLTKAPELPATTLAERCYDQMFYGCTGLTTAPELPATTLANYCYYNMFRNCTSLTTAPELPATTLANYCYQYMFNGCTGLTTAPELPATTLAYSCYQYMFIGCKALTTAPELPATTLANYCYDSMFAYCSALTTAPELLATTLTQGCYSSMFNNCTSLTTAPELPATDIQNASSCYSRMFYNCTSLTTAPELPSTTLAYNCYSSMFYGCKLLTAAPELPVTTLKEGCYQYMFQNCSSLTTAPELLATTLTNTCYQGMFSGCTSLVNVQSILPATMAKDKCYYQMFQNCSSLTKSPIIKLDSIQYAACGYMFSGCTSLIEITCLAKNIYYDSMTGQQSAYRWVQNVSSSGTFYKNPSMTSWTTGMDGIPSGWTVVDYVA